MHPLGPVNSDREYAVDSGSTALARIAAPMRPIANRERANDPARGVRASAASAAEFARPAYVECGGTGDHHEEANHSGQHRPNDDVEPLIPQVVHGEFLINRVRLDKTQPPGARVVPTVAVTIKIASAVNGIRGTTRPMAACPPSGWVTKPAAM